MVNDHEKYDVAVAGHCDDTIVVTVCCGRLRYGSMAGVYCGRPCRDRRYFSWLAGRHCFFAGWRSVRRDHDISLWWRPVQ